VPVNPLKTAGLRETPNSPLRKFHINLTSDCPEVFCLLSLR
jgi:hypothetical protein